MLSNADRGLVVGDLSALTEGLALCGAGETLLSAFQRLNVGVRGVVVVLGFVALGVDFCTLEGFAFGTVLDVVGVAF